MSESRKAAVVEALHALQERLTAAHLAGATADDGELTRDFNSLLGQAKEVFPRSDTLRVIEALMPGVPVPVLAVRLVLMRRTIDAALTEAQSAAGNIKPDRRRGQERRRWQRRDVAWPVRFLFGDGVSVAARAVDASRHGLRLELDNGTVASPLAHGDRCGVEVYLGGSVARFFRIAEVSHVDDRGVGLVISEALPHSLIPDADVTPPAAPPRRRITTDSFARGLRSFFVALRGW